MAALLAVLTGSSQVDATKSFAHLGIDDIIQMGHDDPYNNFFGVTYVL
jgi:hypothetical protein